MPLNDILNCSESDLWTILDAEDAYQQEGWFMAKRIGMIELCQLGEILGVASYDELMGQFNLIGEPRDEGPWPQTIPPSLIDCIRTLSDDEISSVVQTWAGIEEFHGADMTESLVEYLQRFRAYLADRSGEFFMINAL